MTKRRRETTRARPWSLGAVEWSNIREGACAMKPLITLVTLGVDDLPRAVAFYRDGLGLATEGIVGTEFEFGAVAFFELQGGLKLALWPRNSIAHYTGLPQGSPNST